MQGHTTATPPAPRIFPLPRVVPLVLASLVVAACGGEPDAAPADGTNEPEATATTGPLPTDTAPGVGTAAGTGEASLPAEELERGRHDDSWRQYADARSGAREAARSDTTSGSSGQGDESLDDLGTDPLTVEEVRTPLHGDVEGPSVLAVQILLDRALYRPGVMDGRWGKNTEKAVYWMQHAQGLEPTGRVDDRTLEALVRVAGDTGPLTVEHQLSESDVAGPFVSIPEDVYERAELDCLCYESQREQLGERFHSTPELLERLNPGVDLDAVSAGYTLRVPDVPEFTQDGSTAAASTDRGPVAEIVISDGGHYLHALNAAGDIIYHFPSTLGADYAPSPEGDYEIDSIHQDPQWHYQPDLLSRVDPSEPDAMLPAGPNNAVGVVWMQLSKPHYGIHGTSAPSSIGYATSHGCVRLTNWDAEFLSHQIDPGTPVRFVDGTQRPGSAESQPG